MDRVSAWLSVKRGLQDDIGVKVGGVPVVGSGSIAGVPAICVELTAVSSRQVQCLSRT